MDYVQGKERPDVECILCAVRDSEENVVSLKVYEDELCFVTLNLYPYNPGHMMIIPTKHKESLLDLTKDEFIRISRVIQGLQQLLNDLYSPHGYNIGVNEGNDSGGSIKHLHFHIVPRYGSELGYIDIVSHTRVLPEGLKSVRKKIKNKIHDYLNESFFSEF